MLQGRVQGGPGGMAGTDGPRPWRHVDGTDETKGRVWKGWWHIQECVDGWRMGCGGPCHGPTPRGDVELGPCHHPCAMDPSGEVEAWIHHRVPWHVPVRKRQTSDGTPSPPQPHLPLASSPPRLLPVPQPAPVDPPDRPPPSQPLPPSRLNRTPRTWNSDAMVGPYRPYPPEILGRVVGVCEAIPFGVRGPPILHRSVEEDHLPTRSTPETTLGPPLASAVRVPLSFRKMRASTAEDGGLSSLFERGSSHLPLRVRLHRGWWRDRPGRTSFRLCVADDAMAVRTGSARRTGGLLRRLWSTAGIESENEIAMAVGGKPMLPAAGGIGARSARGAPTDGKTK